jgi:hypothetical protein
MKLPTRESSHVSTLLIVLMYRDCVAKAVSRLTFSFGMDNLNGVVNGQEYYRRESCFDITSPVQFSYCDTVTIKGDELECTQSINGIDCNTCTFYYVPETGAFCQAFDCTNKDLGVEGNDCSISLVGALAFE